MSIKLHKLRITFSVFCGIVSLLLVVLWVRSYWRIDTALDSAFQELVGVHSAQGFLIFIASSETPQPNNLIITSIPVSANVTYRPPWYYQKNTGPSVVSYMVCVPHAYLVMFAIAVAAAPWIQLRWHFSLRTLLIATTLIALALGLIVLANR